jgi:hypothetical protein
MDVAAHFLPSFFLRRLFQGLGSNAQTFARSASSMALTLIRDAKRDEARRDFAQQVLRQSPCSALAEALQFDQVFRDAAHLELSVDRRLSLAASMRRTVWLDESIGQRVAVRNQRALNLT